MAEQPSDARPYLFLSYASSDRAQAMRLADTLNAAGIPIWIDRHAIAGATSWGAEIVRGIKRCAAFAVLGSAQAFGSHNVQRELSLAVEEDKPILPLLLEPVQLPDEVRYALAGRQWVEIMDRPATAWLPAVVRALELRGIVTMTAAAAPSADAGSAVQGKLPTPLTSFIGREQELAEVTALLGASRLLTLTGPGGTGKTRLAIAAATHVAAGFADGAWFVDLSGVSDAAGVLPAIALVLGVTESEGRSLAASMAAFLRHKRLLLVLDNFEQVVSAAMQVYDLLAEARGLTVLITSRVLLRVGAEQEYAVLPLPLPPDPDDAESSAFDENPAVRLFVERARSLLPVFGLADETGATIAEICRRLDGLPLAIELAAARIKLLPPQALLARLDRALTFLGGGERSRPERQQTLRAAISWSWELLTPAEQVLFRRLSVFAGGWTLAAADAICCEGDGLDALEGLASLVDKSLVRQRAQEGEPRFFLLATLREYALEQLNVAGEAERIERRHAEYFANLAESAYAAWWRSGRVLADILLPIDPERENLFSALRWAEARKETPLGLRIVGAMWVWFYFRSPGEGCHWSDVMLALPGAEQATLARATSLIGAAASYIPLGNVERAAHYLELAAALFSVIEELPFQSLALSILSSFMPVDEAQHAFECCDEALRLARASGHAHAIVQAEHWGGLCHLARDAEMTVAVEHLEEGLRLARALDADWLKVASLHRLGQVAKEEGRNEEATQRCAEARSVAETLGNRAMVAEVSVYLAQLAGAGRNQTQEAAEWQRGLTAARDMGSVSFTLMCVAGAGGLATQVGEPAHGATLLAASDHIWSGHGPSAVYALTFQQIYEPALAATKTGLSGEAFNRAWAAGQRMSLDQAAVFAIDVLKHAGHEPNRKSS